MLFLFLLLLYSLTLTTATHNATGGQPKEEHKMSTFVIVGLAGGSILVVVIVLVIVFRVILPWRRKKKAYKMREARVLQALPTLKLTRTIEEPEAHSVEMIVDHFDKPKSGHGDVEKSKLGLPPVGKESSKETPSKESATPSKDSKESTKRSSKESNKESTPNKETPTPGKDSPTPKKDTEKSVDTLDFIDSPK